MEYPDPKACHKHGKSKGTAYAGKVKDCVRSGSRVGVIRCRPLQYLFRRSMNTSRHFAGRKKEDLLHRYDLRIKWETVQETDIKAIKSWGMPAI